MGRTTEYERFGKKVKRQGGDVYAGGIFVPRKVGSWEETVPLPDHMQVESEKIEEDLTHNDAIIRYEDLYELPRKYIGEKLELYDLYEKNLCPFCESTIYDQACKKFSKCISRKAFEYMDRCCAQCGAWVEDTRIVQEVEGESGISSQPVSSDNGMMKMKMEINDKYQNMPCECTASEDEELYFLQAKVPENCEHKLERLKKVSDTIFCDHCHNETEFKGMKLTVDRCDFCGDPLADIKKAVCKRKLCGFEKVICEDDSHLDYTRRHLGQHLEECESDGFEYVDVPAEGF